MTIEQTRTPTPEEVLELIRVTARGAIRGLMPARVSAYNAGAQTVTVTPAMRRLQADETYLDDPTLTVPWRGLRVGTQAIHLEPAVGDWVALLIPERSLDAWMGAPAVGIEPADARRFDISDAIAWPLLTPDAVPLAAAARPAGALTLSAADGAVRIEIRANGQVTIHASEVRLGDDTATALALATPTNAELSTLALALAPIVTAWNALATGGGGPLLVPTGTALPVPAHSSVAATKAKGV